MEDDRRSSGRRATDASLAAGPVLQPDILLTDIEMPLMTGLELVAQVKRQGLATRIVIVTTFARAGYLRRALDSGVGGYLLKDTPSEQLAGMPSAVSTAACGH